MRVTVVDSGFGGFRLCALLDAAGRKLDNFPKLNVTFADVTPSEEVYFNSLPYAEQIVLFDKSLNAITREFRPEKIIIACGTLTSLYSHTHYSQSEALPVSCFFDTFAAKYGQSSRQMKDEPLRYLVLGTETTVRSEYFSTVMTSVGVAREDIRYCAFPGVATQISNDFTGLKVERAVASLLEQNGFEQKGIYKPDIVVLACSHYGYQKPVFEKIARSFFGDVSEVVDPMDTLLEEFLVMLRKQGTADVGVSPSVEFFARYDLPKSELQNVGKYIGHISPTALAAMENYTVFDFFRVK